ncbi:MAG: DUF1501 domain-containing protein [Limisphaerales bacterium]
MNTRRAFLGNTGMGMTGMALSAMLFKDGVAQAAPVQPDIGPHFEPKAKSVIWIFLIGGLSHVESFDPKPALNKYAGKSIEDTPFSERILNKDKINENLLDPAKQKREVFKQVMPLQTGYAKYGQSGIEVSDWFPHIGTCADDIAIARGMWTIDNNHGAQLTYHTGRKITEGAFPTIGSWVSYGLGTQNQNLPEFVVLGNPSADCCGAAWTHGASYLGPQYAGVRMKVDPKNPLSFVRPADAKFTIDQQRENFSLLGKLNRLAGIEYPDDPKLQARIKAYELAFEMQTAVPEVLGTTGESEATKELYGFGNRVTKPFGEQLLVARRMVERGVGFIQLMHGSGAAGAWDAHRGLKANHTKLSAQVDLPVAGLLKDLKQRGMLDETLVVFATEFGRTPGSQGTDGRDHHPFGFSVWMAGGGIKGGVVHGATDELGYHADQGRHYVTDVHATLLHQLGLDRHSMEVPGHKRLARDFGNVIDEIVV